MAPHRAAASGLDAGGYARYDFRAAFRLLALSEIIDERYDGQAAEIGRRHQACPALRTALIVLPGRGPVTVELFLRELRGGWPGAQPPVDPRRLGARHLGLLSTEQPRAALPEMARLAAVAGLGIRDLESGLVRLAPALPAYNRSLACVGGSPASGVLSRWRGGGGGCRLAEVRPVIRICG